LKTFPIFFSFDFFFFSFSQCLCWLVHHKNLKTPVARFLPNQPFGCGGGTPPHNPPPRVFGVIFFPPHWFCLNPGHLRFFFLVFFFFRPVGLPKEKKKKKPPTGVLGPKAPHNHPPPPFKNHPEDPRLEITKGGGWLNSRGGVRGIAVVGVLWGGLLCGVLNAGKKTSQPPHLPKPRPSWGPCLFLWCHTTHISSHPPPFSGVGSFCVGGGKPPPPKTPPTHHPQPPPKKSGSFQNQVQKKTTHKKWPKGPFFLFAFLFLFLVSRF